MVLFVFFDGRDQVHLQGAIAVSKTTLVSAKETLRSVDSAASMMSARRLNKEATSLDDECRTRSGPRYVAETSAEVQRSSTSLSQKRSAGRVDSETGLGASTTQCQGRLGSALL